jgi:CubicO group peptidase (beta-lactamase class C family)
MTAVRILVKLTLIFLFACNAWANEMPYGWNVTNGFRGTARIGYASPPAEAKQIPLKQGAASAEAKRVLDDLFTRNNTKALLVARGDEILYERYSFGVGKRNTPLGYSVSKSLTALTVGRAICDGHIASIEDPLKKYVPALADTSWGDASVSSVLKMASGAYQTSMQFNGHKNREIELAVGPPIAEGRLDTDFADLMKAVDEKRYPPGVLFNYSNFDTVALGLLVQAATAMPFNAYFEKSIWEMVGAESRGGWFMNGKGQASTYNGFSATPHDWLRVGLMVLREKKRDTCFGKFVKDLSAKHLDSFGPAREYGYQTWVRCASASDFCFVGFGGQYLLFNVETNTVLYHHATTFSPVVWQTPRVMDELIPLLKSQEK